LVRDEEDFNWESHGTYMFCPLARVTFWVSAANIAGPFDVGNQQMDKKEKTLGS
jgi:hypothetical protein